MKSLIVAALLLSSPAVAADYCHLSTPQAIICTRADNAATAYWRFGRSGAAINGRFLTRYGCGFALRRGSPVTPRLSGTVALPYADVGVAAILMEGGIWFVASDYLTPACRER